MKILVTGGAGFIGRNLVEFLLFHHTVLVYDDLSSSSKSDVESLVKKGAKFLQGDILDVNTLCKFSEGVDVVIHLAAISDVNESMIHPEITKKINVDGTKNVLQCCIKNKIKKIIFASSAAVYGDCYNTITEKTPTNPLSPYGQSKLDAEETIVKTCKENKIDYIIFRMFNVYGKGQNKQYAGVIAKFLDNITQNKPLVIYGDGKQTRDFVSICDIIDAFGCAMQSDKNNTYNIASGISLSINELAKIMSDVFGKVEVKYFDKQKGDIKNSVVDVTLAKEELGFSAKKSLREELARL